jgi:ribosome production factor 1
MLTAKPTRVEASGTTSENAADGAEASTSAAPTVQLDDENAYDISVDPFASYFSSAAAEDGEPLPPKVLITTSSKATKVAFDFCEELVGVVPGSEFIRRKKSKGFEIGRIAGWASGRGYTSMMVVNEDRKKCSA